MIIPQKKEFLNAARRGSVYPVYTDLPEVGTPLDIYERLAVEDGTQTYSYLLESGRIHAKTGRYSFIGTMPFLLFKSKGDKVLLTYLNEDGSQKKTYRYQGYPLSFLKEILQKYRTVKVEGLPNFTGGAVGYIGYDACHFFEKLPRLAVDDLGIPDIFFVFTRIVIAYDHLKHGAKVIASPVTDDDGYEAAYEKAVSLVDSVVKRISGSSAPDAVKAGRPPGYSLDSQGDMSLWVKAQENEGDARSGLKRNERLWHESSDILRSMEGREYRNFDEQDLFKRFSIESNFSRMDFEAVVEKTKKYIKAGDIFQANLSQRLCAPMRTEPWLLYKTLSGINPSPFACYLDLGDIKIASSSPERLVSVEGSLVETRPIAGTRPRGKDGSEDMELCRELILSEKERAEHIMLVDLERNDLGRVCEYGSVRVDELMALEEYSHVIHIVSNVRGVLRPDKDRFDLIAAAFPGGTITGTPKVRCMEIIDELEPVTRGIYTGSVGYLSFNGDMDLNIVIRTFLIKGDKAYVQVGAGIVADSDPAREYYETLYKAEALLKALELTGVATP